MNTEYGKVEYIGLTNDLEVIYVYGINGILVNAGYTNSRPRVSLLRCTNAGRFYFLKKHKRVYIDELEKMKY